MTLIVYLTLLILTGIFLTAGLYQFSLIIFGLPSVKTSRTIKAIVKRKKSIKSKERSNDSALHLIAKFIRLNPYKRDTIAQNLKIAGISKTPEVFYAGAVYSCIKFIIPAVILLFVFPYVAPVFIILAVLKFLQELQKADDCIKEKRKQIDYDLPRFVYSVLYELKNSHDVLTIFERHKDGFSPEFGSEIAITIADMRTGNYKSALQRFEGRIGSTSLSEVVRGLIEMDSGHDTHIYWETLAFRFSEMQKQQLRKEAQKIPPKVRKLSFCLLMCIIATYIVVLGVQLIENIAILF